MAAHLTSPTSDRALQRALDLHARMALDLAGGHHSDATRYAPMHGRVPTGMIAFAGWDGTIHLGRNALATVSDLFDARGAARRPGPGPAGARALVHGLHTCLHEHAHLIMPAGQTFADHAPAYARWPVTVVEEGVTEAWSQDRLAGFLRRHDALVPGLDPRAADTTSYSAFVPAVRQLARCLGDRLGVQERDVIATLNRRGPAAKLAMVAYLGLRAGDAWERMPVGRRRGSLVTVAAVLGNVFERNRPWSELDGKGRWRTGDVVGRSAIMGLEAVAAIDRTVRELRHRHVAPDRDWHRTSLEYEVALARHARTLTRGRHADSGRAAGDWYGETKAKLQGARARALDPSVAIGGGL